jgi:phosphatidylinositol kinase/protein kinase (PI-3  family)
LIRSVNSLFELRESHHLFKGKILPVAERVPFRMTADMVDGLGTSGTQGVFQRCAEETLRVLREGSEVIMTVLEVFKHDPLHSWYIVLPAFSFFAI